MDPFFEGKRFTDAFPALQSIRQRINRYSRCSRWICLRKNFEHRVDVSFDVDKDLRQKKTFESLRDRLGLPGGGLLRCERSDETRLETSES